MGVAPSRSGVAADDSEGDEGTETEDDGKDVSAHVLNSDGGDRRGTSKHDDGARSTEPPNRDTKEVSNQTGEAGGAVGPAAARRAAGLLFRERRKLGVGMSEADGCSGVERVGDDVEHVGDTASQVGLRGRESNCIVGGTNMIDTETRVNTAEFRREFTTESSTHRFFARAEDVGAESAHVSTATREIDRVRRSDAAVCERTEARGKSVVASVVHAAETINIRVLTRMIAAEGGARVSDGGA